MWLIVGQAVVFAVAAGVGAGVRPGVEAGVGPGVGAADPSAVGVGPEDPARDGVELGEAAAANEAVGSEVGFAVRAERLFDAHPMTRMIEAIIARIAMLPSRRRLLTYFSP